MTAKNVYAKDRVDRRLSSIEPTFPLVFEALEKALQGRPLTLGGFLTVSTAMVDPKTISDGVLPFLMLSTGDFSVADDGDENAIMNIRARGALKVSSFRELDAGKVLRQTLQDLFQFCWATRGLYVDVKTQELVSWFEPEKLANRGCSRMEGLASIANYGGPTLTTGRTIEIPGWPYAVAEVQIALSVSTRLEWRQFAQAHSVILGMRTGTELSDANADFIYTGRSVTDPVSGIGADGEPLASTPLSAQLHRVAPVPQAFTLATAATRQLTGIGTYGDGSTRNFTTTGTWQSGTPAVATVSATGLVTGVSAGTSTITLTANGVAGTATVTVT